MGETEETECTARNPVLQEVGVTTAVIAILPLQRVRKAYLVPRGERRTDHSAEK